MKFNTDILENCSYVESFVLGDQNVIDTVENELRREYQDNIHQYQSFQGKREPPETVTGRDVRLATLWSVGSIKTDTGLIDSKSSDMVSGDFSVDKDILENSTDGGLKWEKYHEWFAGDVPDRVANLLNDDRLNDAHALLAGRDPDTGAMTEDYYLRACKGAMVLYLLGYDKVCMDTRIYRTLKPVIAEVMAGNQCVAHPDTESQHPYRAKQPRMGAKPVPILSHSGDQNWEENRKSFWEDKLKWNIPEYDALTQWIIKRLSIRTDIPAPVLPQVAFNALSDDTTTHDAILDRI